MRIVVNEKDISQLIVSLKWSGDDRQRTRSIDFSYMYKKNIGIPEIEIRAGDTIALYDTSGKRRFVGVTTALDSELDSEVVKIIARDLLWYLGKNKVSMVYEGTGDEITRRICKEFNIPIGKIPDGKEEKQIISTGDKTVYQIISEAYGKGYYIWADEEKLSVSQRGSEIIAVISGNSNLINAKYRLSIESMLNRIVIIDKDGKIIGSVQNDKDQIYGLMQGIYKKEENKDPTIEARKLLRSIDTGSTLECLGNWDCVAGKGIYIMDTSNNMLGKFVITDDVHTFDKGIHKMTLGVELMEVL